MTGVDVITAILLAGILVAVIVYLLYWLYQRSSKEVSFVRTGFGGEKVVLSGGALVLPIVHNVTLVGMKTLRIEVRRSGPAALITRDRMRVEVVADFYLRVRSDRESVTAAAQSLGGRTMDAEALKELVQGRFVDALSSVAARMTMDEMQEERGTYVNRVKELVENVLARNGLEMEAHTHHRPSSAVACSTPSSRSSSKLSSKSHMTSSRRRYAPVSTAWQPLTSPLITRSFSPSF